MKLEDNKSRSTIASRIFKILIGPIIVGVLVATYQTLFEGILDSNPSPEDSSLLAQTDPLVLPPGQLAFATNENGNYDIYLMDIDGSDKTRLTDNTGDDLTPAWSPDGSKITFTSNRYGDNEIYIMNADGSGLTQITFNDAYDCCSHWSPDGLKLVYNSNLPDGDQDIYVIGLDGNEPIIPVNLTDFPGDDQRPFWSPDGSKIGFEARRDGQPDIYVMNADGSNPQRLTSFFSDQKSGISWSPNGVMLAYESNQRLDNGNETGDINVFVMFADGSGQVPITTEASEEKNPDWSQDGQYILFTSTRDGNNEIYLMEWNGKRIARLTNTPFNEISPAWRSSN